MVNQANLSLYFNRRPESIIRHRLSLKDSHDLITHKFINNTLVGLNDSSLQIKINID